MRTFGNTFSDEIYDVEITSNKVPDLEMIDMPGIITNPDQQARACRYLLSSRL